MDRESKEPEVGIRSGDGDRPRLGRFAVVGGTALAVGVAGLAMALNLGLIGGAADDPVVGRTDDLDDGPGGHVRCPRRGDNGGFCNIDQHDQRGADGPHPNDESGRTGFGCDHASDRATTVDNGGR